MRRPSIALIVLATALAPAAPGADLRVDDLRLSCAWMPDSGSDVLGHYDDTSSDGSVDSHGHLQVTRTSTARARWTLAWLRSLHELEAGRGSLLYGFGIVADRQNSAAKIETDLWLGEASVGWVWPLAPAWQIEESFFIGGGTQRTRMTSSRVYTNGGEYAPTSTDFAYEYGMRLGTVWTHTSGVQAGLHAQYLIVRATARLVDSNDVGGVVERVDYRPDITMEGFSFALSLGYRL